MDFRSEPSLLGLSSPPSLPWTAGMVEVIVFRRPWRAGAAPNCQPVKECQKRIETLVLNVRFERLFHMTKSAQNACTRFVGSREFREQSENVYENKRLAQISTTSGPSLPKEGNSRLPSSHEEGLGVVRVSAAGYSRWRIRADSILSACIAGLLCWTAGSKI